MDDKWGRAQISSRRVEHLLGRLPRRIAVLASMLRGVVVAQAFEAGRGACSVARRSLSWASGERTKVCAGINNCRGGMNVHREAGRRGA